MTLFSNCPNLQKVGHDIVIFNGNVLGHAWHTWCKKCTNGKKMSCSLLICHTQIFKSIDFRTMGLWIWITFFLIRIVLSTVYYHNLVFCTVLVTPCLFLVALGQLAPSNFKPCPLLLRVYAVEGTVLIQCCWIFETRFDTQLCINLGQVRNQASTDMLMLSAWLGGCSHMYRANRVCNANDAIIFHANWFCPCVSN